MQGSVLEHYREMLAFRRDTAALRVGRTRFLDLPDPVLGFVRGNGFGCFFNLSPKAVTVEVAGLGTLTVPCLAAEVAGNTLRLGPNGVAFAQVG